MPRVSEVRLSPSQRVACFETSVLLQVITPNQVVLATSAQTRGVSPEAAPGPEPFSVSILLPFDLDSSFRGNTDSSTSGGNYGSVYADGCHVC